MHYLSACNRGQFKSYYCYVLFLDLKNPSNIMKNIFNFISIYSWEKEFLVNKYKKPMCYKENKSLFFDVMKNSQIFLLRASL